MKRNEYQKNSNIIDEEKSSNTKNIIDISNDKDKNEIKNISMVQYFREYTENTSLHGFKYLGEKDKSALHKIWWILMITLSIIGCGYLINSLWVKWDLSPVIVSFSKTTTPIWMIPFPAITICPSIKIRQSIYNFTEKTKQKTIENEKDEYHLYAGICGTCTRDDCDYSEYEYVNDSVIDKIVKVSLTLDDTFLGCEYERAIFCDNLFTPIMTDEGLCYTSNMLDANEIYKNETKQYGYNFLKNEKNHGWTIDTGYDKDLPVDIYPARGKGSGLRSALTIFIQRKSSESDELCDQFSQAFKAIVHSPSVIPRVTKNFYWVHAGMDMMISIKPRMMKTSKILRNYTPQRRMCYFSNEKPLRFFKNYTQENCELECLANYTMASCGCVTYDMPRVDSMPICGIGKITCSEHASRNIQLIQIKLKNTTVENVFIELRAKEIASKCDCLPGCTSIDYDVEISDSPVDWGKVVSVLTDDEDNTSYGQISKMKIFFKDPYFVTTKRSELYGLIDFLANCGGLLGVCLGFSILSLVELLYFATLRLFSYIFPNHSNTEKIEKIPNEKM